MRKHFKWVYLIIGLSVLAGVCIGVIFQPLFSGDNIFNEVKKFNYVLNTTYRNYVDPVDSHKLVASAIQGMLGNLDPHSVYIPEKDMKNVDEDFSGAFEGIGIEFDVIHDTVTVVSPIQGGPSDKLGILAADKIVKIDGKNAIGISRDDVRKKLKGPKGTHVNVDIKREGEKALLHFDIVRDKIPLYTVSAHFMIDRTDIGLIQINRFAATTYDEMISALRSLKEQGMKKLIIDLRGNPGGYLQQAYMVANEFLNPGDTIVYTKGRLPEFDQAFVSQPGGQFTHIPLVLMINSGSASASEIVSGAMQDLDRGLIVGTTSFGKGLVQRQYPCEDGSAFRITTAHYYTPSGRCIQRPYKDKDQYFHLAGRLDLKPGNYIDNSIEKIKEHLRANSKHNEAIDVDSLPIYYTKSGRIVLGGGGITPDIIVKVDSLTHLGVQIRMKNILNEFMNDYVDYSAIKKQYSGKFMDFFRNYKVSESLVSDFKKLAISKGVKWDDEQYNKDKDYFLAEIKSSIANSIWGQNESMQVFYTIDNQVKVAEDSFSDIAKLKQRPPKQ